MTAARLLHPEARVERVAQPAAEEVQREPVFGRADDTAKGKILQKAKDLGLVPPETVTTTFGGNLSDAARPDKPEVTRKLEEL